MTTEIGSLTDPDRRPCEIGPLEAFSDEIDPPAGNKGSRMTLPEPARTLWRTTAPGQRAPVLACVTVP